MPDHYRRRVARPVSYYALFKGMAASKPTSWLSGQPNILLCQLIRNFGALAGVLGFYPLATGLYHPAADCLSTLHGIRSLSRFGRR